MMMNGQPLPPLPSPRDVATFVALLELIMDPAAAKSRLDEFAGAADMLRLEIANLEQAQKNLAAEREILNQTIVAEKAAMSGLEQGREALNREIANRTQVLDDREASIADLKRKAEAEVEEAAKLRKNLEQRLARMAALAA
jgi:chromosome segregation ATPase